MPDEAATATTRRRAPTTADTDDRRRASDAAAGDAGPGPAPTGHGELDTERHPDRRLRRPARCRVPGGRRPAARGVGGGARRVPADEARRCAADDAPVFIDDQALERGETISLADASSATRIEPRLRERRIAVKRAVGRKRLRWVFVVAVVVALVVAALAVLGSSLFAIDEVHVDGAVYTDPVGAAGGRRRPRGHARAARRHRPRRARAGGDPVGRRRPRHDAVPRRRHHRAARAGSRRHLPGPRSALPRDRRRRSRASTCSTPSPSSTCWSPARTCPTSSPVSSPPRASSPPPTSCRR